MKPIDDILNNEKGVLEFLKRYYPMYHLSNVFFRDVQYGIRTMIERRGQKIGYVEAENIARSFVEKLEKEKILTPIDGQTWVLNYPAFKKPAVVQTTPAKPAPGAAPAKLPTARPASGQPAARTPLPPLSSAKPAGASAPAAAASKLPPLTSAKPTDGRALGEEAPQASSSPPGLEPKPEAPRASPAPATPSPAPQPQAAASSQPGVKKALPPLKGNYTPVGKK